MSTVAPQLANQRETVKHTTVEAVHDRASSNDASHARNGDQGDQDSRYESWHEKFRSFPLSTRDANYCLIRVGKCAEIIFHGR